MNKKQLFGLTFLALAVLVLGGYVGARPADGPKAKECEECKKQAKADAKPAAKECCCAVAVKHEGHEHGEAFLKCAKACSACQLECAACFNHCMKHTSSGHKEHAATARTCADCEKCCALAASLCAGQSPMATHVCDACAKCCDDCAKACEAFKGDKQMAQCAKACRDCAKACREMTKHAKH